MAKGNGGTRQSSSNSPNGITPSITPIEDNELTAIRNATTRYNEAKTASDKERARYSVNYTINNIQTRVELALSNLNENIPSEAQEIKRLQKYYDLIKNMRV